MNYSYREINMNYTDVYDLQDRTVYTENTTDKPVNNKHLMEDIKEFQTVFLVFLLITNIVGNSIVLVAVSVAKNRSRMTFFILHLAIADLLVGLVSLLPDFIWRLVDDFHGGEALCKIVKFSQCLVTYGSTFVLVALSIDRLDAIARPLGFSTSKTRNRILVSTAWLIAAVFSIPQAILFKTDKCMIRLPSAFYWRLYVTLIASAVFIIPAIIIAICYGVMVYIIVSKSSALMATGKKTQERKPLYYRQDMKNHRVKVKDPNHRIQHESRASSRGIIPQAKIRTIKMTFVIVIVFILCWSPYFMWNLFSVYGLIEHNSINQAITMFVQSLAPINSSINPIIYGIFSTRICRQLRRFRVVKAMCDVIPICGDQSENRVSNDNSTMMTETYTFRNKSNSPRRSIYSQGEHLQMETCDLIASVLPEKGNLKP